VLGLALNIYNEFGINKSDKWEFTGFDEKYSNEDNLICISMKKTYEYAHKDEIKASIRLIKSDVPNTRGLGSSATCVVAGVMAANKLMGDILKKEDMLQIATYLEGFPDNVTPALYGGLTASYITDTNIVKTIKYQVNEKLRFLACIPPLKISTKESRRRLPHELSYEDIVYNTSRLVNLPYAFLSGDLNLIRDILSDKMHEPYRIPQIHGAELIKNYAKENNLPVFLSGSGSTMIIIFKEKIDYSHLLELGWNFIILDEDNVGATYEE